MTKQDLKAGMIVQHRNGELSLIITDTAAEVYPTKTNTIVNKQSNTSLNNFNEDLTFKPTTSYDIVAVYAFSTLVQAFTTVANQTFSGFKTTLWERTKEGKEEDLKSLLKTGRTVLLKSGHYGLILGNSVVCCEAKRGGGGIPLTQYSNMLINTIDKPSSIIKIFEERQDCSGSGLKFKAEYPEYLIGKEIWARPLEENLTKQVQPEEMTIEQICKELGKEIKIIKS